MTQHNSSRSSLFIERVNNGFNTQRQYWALWFKSRLRRTRVPQVFMLMAAVLLSALMLSIVMATIVTFDIALLLVSVLKRPFHRKKTLRFTVFRANA